MDEAGRGAVIGPLVVAGVWAPPHQAQHLWTLGARDSKALAREKRPEVLRRLFAAGVRGRALVIPAPTVNEQNLTQIELAAFARLVSLAPPPLTQVVLDPPVGPRAIARFSRALSEATGFPFPQIASFPKADRDHPLVASASILAKVVRDGYVRVLRKTYGDFGWGYPGEPKVQAFLLSFLREGGTFPPICRSRWRTVQRLSLELQGQERSGRIVAET